ncbi:tRNA pseudouridine(38-40) synthase [hydrothermal vent metagenome]|uniref:tRNA pseudouridine(38-40) synthase n=1 Tax=hydrothermal vent metagenome TaxID=652676 RepID=A0A3B0Z8Z2_9ZZZZ
MNNNSLITKQATQRLALAVEYDGSQFSGWQIQKNARSVQHVVQQALSTVANHEVVVSCAGRTDAGVHALSQIVHFDTSAQRSLRSWVYGTNANLPKEVCIQWAHPVDAEFHARFSAQRRQYRYVIFNRAVRPTFLANKVTWCYHDLDESLMAEAAHCLLGKHDFSSYRAIGCQAKSPIRTLHRLSVCRYDQFITLDLEANGFLHHMVRNIAGVLMDIGAGKAPVSWAQEVLEHKNRTLGGVTAQPYGLYFVGVRYPDKYQFPKLSLSTLGLPLVATL